MCLIAPLVAFLTGCATDFGAKQGGSAHSFPLNHLYLAVSSNTLNAITSSQWTATNFATPKYATASNSLGMQWTAAYFSGEETYIEILQSDAPVFEKLPAKEGINLGIDSPTNFAKLRLELARAMPDLIITNNTNFSVSPRGNRPWFHGIKPLNASLQAPVTMYLMQYDEGYISCDCHKGQVSRGAYLFHRRKAAKDSNSPPLFEDVLEIHCAVNAPEAALIQQWLQGLGYRPRSKTPFARYETERFAIVLNRHTSGKVGIRKIVCALRENHSSQPKEARFGSDCKLLIKGKKATWSFD
jgi:hypothetical protein